MLNLIYFLLVTCLQYVKGRLGASAGVASVQLEVAGLSHGINPL